MPGKAGDVRTWDCIIVYVPTTKEKMMRNVGYELNQMIESINETILESNISNAVWATVESACSDLGIVVPDGNNEDEVENADAEFVSNVRAEYSAIVEEFEGIVRSFYETSNELELLNNLKKISFFY
jgi:hypothetical protein